MGPMGREKQRSLGTTQAAVTLCREKAGRSVSEQRGKRSSGENGRRDCSLGRAVSRWSQHGDPPPSSPGPIHPAQGTPPSFPGPLRVRERHH